MIDGRDEFEEGANEGRGHFHFVGSDEHRLDNLVPSRADDNSESSAPSTSRTSTGWRSRRDRRRRSGGFEPAYVDSYNGAVVDLDAGPVTADATGEGAAADAASAEPALRNMGFAFASHREQRGTPYRIVDGAVFDNVPIDRALRAARTRSSERRADRAMLFLDPEPDPPLGSTVGWDPDASRFFRAIGAMLSRQFRKESVSREVADLEEFNAERSVAAARLQGAAPLVAAALAAEDTSAERTRTYVRSLGPIVADHLAEAISAPSLWQLNTLLPERRKYRPIERVELAGLTQAAIRRFDVEAERHPAASARSITALADAANCVLGWTRAIESVPERGSRRGLAFPDVREAAYATLRFATDERDRLTASVLLQSDRIAARHETPGTRDFESWIDTWITGVARVRTAAYGRSSTSRWPSSGSRAGASSRRSRPGRWRPRTGRRRRGARSPRRPRRSPRPTCRRCTTRAAFRRRCRRALLGDRGRRGARRPRRASPRSPPTGGTPCCSPPCGALRRRPRTSRSWCARRPLAS